MHKFGSLVGAFLLTLLLAASSSATARQAPTLTLRGLDPVSVHGSHFRAGERVRVSSSAGPVRTVKANRAGVFTVTWPGRPADRCSSLSVHAAGAAGSVATLKLPRPACLPAASA